MAEFVHTHNQGQGSTLCLHSEQGPTVDAIRRELAELSAQQAAFWVLRDADGVVQGWAGCEFDETQSRGWLRGPLVAPGAPAESMQALLQAVEEGLPSLNCLDAFPAEGASALNRLYQHAGYERVDVHRVMRAPLPGRPPSAAVAVTSASHADLPALLALHHALFPASYLSDADIAAALQGSERGVRVCDGGYVIATDEPDMDEVYVDFLGVEPGHRGRGLGRALLEAAMDWGSERGRGFAALTVRQDRLPAMALYQRCGFEQTSAGVQWRKRRTPDETAPS